MTIKQNIKNKINNNFTPSTAGICLVRMTGLFCLFGTRRIFQQTPSSLFVLIDTGHKISKYINTPPSQRGQLRLMMENIRLKAVPGSS